MLQLQIDSQTTTLLLPDCIHLTDDVEFLISGAADEFDLAGLVVGEDLDAVLEEVENELGKGTH